MERIALSSLKPCRLCGEVKEEVEYYIRKDTGKRRGFCKGCIAERNRDYRGRNKVMLSKMKLRWQIENKDKRAAISKRYYLKNKVKVNEYVKYYKREMRTPKQRLRDNISRRIWRALKCNMRSKKTMELIGCSVDNLKAHLESKFVDGMDWGNYGKWHVDHIMPCASFDLSNGDQQRECFHYSNLQPLWAIDNRRKSAYCGVNI